MVSVLGDDHREMGDEVLAVVPDEPAGVARERLRVPADDLPPPLVPLVETGEPDAEDGGLELVEARVPASCDVRSVLLRPAVLAQRAHALVDRGIVRDHRAAVADGGEVLRRVEAERGRVAEGPRPPPAAPRPGGLRAVLDDGDAPPSAELDDPLDVAHQPVEVRGDDGARRRPSAPASTVAAESPRVVGSTSAYRTTQPSLRAAAVV